MRTLLLSIALLSFAPGLAEPTEAPEELLFYENENPFLSSSRWNWRLTSGIDFSNPYVFLYAYGLSTSYSFDRTLSVALEVCGYTAQTRKSTEALEDVLGRYGYVSATAYPSHSVTGVVRLTPISGLLNFIAGRVLSADISILLRAGRIDYHMLDVSPLFGTGVEVHLGVNPHLGFAGSLVWDAQQVPGYHWESRVGFRISPSWRF